MNKVTIRKHATKSGNDEYAVDQVVKRTDKNLHIKPIARLYGYSGMGHTTQPENHMLQH